MTENVKICRICLTLIQSNIYNELDATRLQMLKLISPLSEVLESTKSILCDNCSGNLQRSFDFKTDCLNNELYLKSFHCDSQDNVKLTLQYIIDKDINEEGIKKEDESVCRLCFGYYENTFFTDLSRIDDDFFLGDMIEKCLPEINLDCTRQPLICQDCMQLLQSQFNVVSTLLDTNDKINDYISHMALSNNNVEVDLREVLKFTLDTKTEGENHLSLDKVKVEYEEGILEGIEQSEIHIKVEEELFFNDEESSSVNRDKTLVKQETEENAKTINTAFEKNSEGLYSCAHCRHVTTKKPSLILHLLTHKSTAPQFKCDNCDFTTKWRASLYQHSWLHKEVEMHQCPHCSYKTRYKKHLRRHGKCHGNISSLPTNQCQYCKFATTDKTYFKLHNKNKHKVEVKFDKTTNTFECPLCGYTTYKKSLLTHHCKKMHNRLVCEYCGFQATTLWHLNNHKLKHQDGEEVTMLHCAKCEFKTKYKNSLKTHLARHESKKKRGKLGKNSRKKRTIKQES